MKCDEFKSDLIDLVYGELDASSEERIHAHLERCEACREERGLLESVSRMLQEHLGSPEETPAGLFSRMAHGSKPRAFTPGARPWRRFAAAAAIVVTASLFALSAANAHLSHGPTGWTLQFSLVPRAPSPAALPQEEIARQIDERVAAILQQRLDAERSSTLAAFNRRLEEDRQKTLTDLSRALLHQEQVLSAGYQSDREELLKRDSAVEQMLGSEISRTHQMMGAVLAASRPAVLEQ